MKVSQIALQLHTVRHSTKTPTDFAASLARVKKIGYQTVELAGTGPVTEAELRRMLDGEGLTPCALHDNIRAILSETDKTVDRLGTLGCRYAVIPYPNGIDLTDITALADFIREMDAAGRTLREAGFGLTYHNHELEFHRVQGKTVLDWIFDGTTPDNLTGELDTHWVQRGGGDSVAWCRRLKGRLPLLHLKDYVISGPNHEPRFAEIGSGNLDMPAIVKAAEDSGCQWFIVEQDNCYGADPFDCLATSYRYMEHLAVEGV